MTQIVLTRQLYSLLNSTSFHQSTLSIQTYPMQPIAGLDWLQTIEHLLLDLLLNFSPFERIIYFVKTFYVDTLPFYKCIFK